MLQLDECIDPSFQSRSDLSRTIDSPRYQPWSNPGGTRQDFEARQLVELQYSAADAHTDRPARATRRPEQATATAPGNRCLLHRLDGSCSAPTTHLLDGAL